MTGTVPAAQVRALAAAIRTALDPPPAALSMERARLIEERAAYVCGALGPLATGQDTQIWADAAADAIREAVTDLPVRYATREDTSAPLDRGRYDAASAAEVAEGAEPRWNCTDECCQHPGHGVPVAEPFPHLPHLPQHQHGRPECICGGIDHDAAATFAAPAWIRHARQSPGYLAPPAGYQLHSASIPPQEMP